jgi:nitrate reductase gamma subunit
LVFPYVFPYVHIILGILGTCLRWFKYHQLSWGDGTVPSSMLLKV